MLEPLLGSPLKEQLLYFLMLQGEGYPSGLARSLGRRLFPIQDQLRKLEDGGIVVSRLKGRTRVYSLNPRYAFLKELLPLLLKAYEYLPKKEKEVFKERTRPRKGGKTL